jgi:hypothetical protein
MPTSTKENGSFPWSNRILLISAAGILFLTLFPFRFLLHGKPSSVGMFPFFHWQLSENKNPGALDAALNVLLFVPFGFGLADKLREKGKSRAATLALVWAAGALFSYTVEVFQIYIPARDSGWGDVITNSTGSMVGFLAYETYGKWMLRGLRSAEVALGALLRPRPVALILLAYFAIWFVVSGRLQATTRLSGWDPDPILVVGNDTSLRPWQAWKGQVLSLELWDRAIPDAAARAFSAEGAADAGALDSATAPTAGPAADGVDAPLAAYHMSKSDSSAGSPVDDSMKLLPALAWRPSFASSNDTERLALEGQAWLVSETPAPQLIQQLEKSNQFSIRVVCKPVDLNDTEGRILTIGPPAAPPDLVLRQDQGGVIFGFHTPLAARRAQLGWSVPGVFAAGRASDLLYTYDGASLSLFVNGQKEARPYHLGPGPALARTIRRIRPAELDGYTDVYYAILFFPAGVLLGFAARNLGSAQGHGGIRNGACLALLLVGAPLALEILLARASGGPLLIGRAVLGFAFFLAGALWINVERSYGGPKVAAGGLAGPSATEHQRG